MYQVYLSGPMQGLTLREATEWRNEVAEAFMDFEIEVLDPMRDLEGDPDDIIDCLMADIHTVQSIDPSMLTDRGIVVRDHNDTTRSDVLIVNLLGAKERSIGSVAELAWAYDHQIPTIVIIEPSGNPHEHPFVRAFSAYRVDSVERAVRVAKSVLGAQCWF